MVQFCQIANPSLQKKLPLILDLIFNFICMYKMVHLSKFHQSLEKFPKKVELIQIHRVPSSLTRSSPSTTHQASWRRIEKQLSTPSKLHSSLKHDEKCEPVGCWWERKRPYVQHRGVSVTCPVRKDLACQVVQRPDWEWGDTCCWGGGNLISSRQSMDGVSSLCTSCCSPATCLINE